LASQFNEALKRELLATSELGPIERSMVVAAANHCRHAASASISPAAMLAEVRQSCPQLAKADVGSNDDEDASTVARRILDLYLELNRRVGS
jgi:hypothetical protein